MPGYSHTQAEEHSAAGCQMAPFSDVLLVLSDSEAHLSSLYNCFAVYICIAEHHLACKKAIRMEGCGSTGIAFLQYLDERWNLLQEKKKNRFSVNSVFNRQCCVQCYLMCWIKPNSVFLRVDCALSSVLVLCCADSFYRQPGNIS